MRASSLGQLRRMVREAMSKKVAAGASYQEKERIRERVQALVQGLVDSGAVNDDAALAALFSDITLAVTMLKAVPIDVWRKMSKAKKKNQP